MSKTKRNLLLATGITGVSIAGVFTLLYLCTIIDFIQYIGITDIDLTTFIVVGIIIMLIEIARIVFYSIMLSKPRNGGWRKGIVITNIVLTGILLLLYIITIFANGGALSILGSIANIALIVLLICTMAIGNNNENNNKDILTNNKNKEPNAKQIIENDDSKLSTIDEKINRIKSLNAEGIISDEEMKALILDEIKK